MIARPIVKLSELLDVNATAAASGDVLVRDAGGEWDHAPVIADANAFVRSGAGTQADPWILDTAAIAAVANDTTISFRPGRHYGFTNQAGIAIPTNKHGIRLLGNGATVWNSGSARAQCLLSTGGWDASGNAVGSPTDCNDWLDVCGLTFNGGSNGATTGLRAASAHFSRFERLDFRNYTATGILNLGGVFTQYDSINLGETNLSGLWTRYFTAVNGIVLDGQPDGSGGFYPGSTISLYKVAGRNHSGDGVRILNNFNTVCDMSTIEAVVQGPIYSVANGPSASPPYTGDGSESDYEIFTRGNHGAGYYLGPLAYDTVLRGIDPEYSGEAPDNAGYKMGVVVDGASNTRIENSSMFNAMILVNNGAKRTVIAGCKDTKIWANGQGVILQGGTIDSGIKLGTQLKGFHHTGGDYSDGKFDKTPPMKVGGFYVGYDYYNNPGPIAGTLQYPMLVNAAVAEAGNGYPGYAVFQDGIGRTRVGGMAQVTVGPNDIANITCAYASGVSKLSFFGAAAVAKPTVSGSRGGNAALASLLTQLAALGLVTDSTTA